MMRRARTCRTSERSQRSAGWPSTLFPLATLVLLISGGYLVNKFGASWGDGWVNTSAIALVLMAVAALKITTLKMNEIHFAAEDAPDGPIPPALAVKLVDPVLFAVTHAITVGMLGIIWNMTTKPGDAEAGIVIVVAALIGAASAIPMMARRRALLEDDA